MFDSIKRFFGPSHEERALLDAIQQSGITSMRVVGRGTLTLDVREVRSNAKFREFAHEAQQIVAGADR